MLRESRWRARAAGQRYAHVTVTCCDEPWWGCGASRTGLRRTGAVRARRRGPIQGEAFIGTILEWSDQPARLAANGTQWPCAVAPGRAAVRAAPPALLRPRLRQNLVHRLQFRTAPRPAHGSRSNGSRTDRSPESL